MFLKSEKYYTGIGSRQTPNNVLRFMTQLARFFDKYGFILRSGGAPGADSAFESGSTNKEIYLPWKNFNNNDSHLYQIGSEAANIARRFHPNWFSLKDSVKKLHTRNVYQVLGKSLDKPSDLVICWTSDGKASGGTGQAIRIAKYYEIPVYNLNNEEEKRDLTNLVSNVRFLMDCF